MGLIELFHGLICGPATRPSIPDPVPPITSRSLNRPIHIEVSPKTARSIYVDTVIPLGLNACDELGILLAHLGGN